MKNTTYAISPKGFRSRTTNPDSPAQDYETVTMHAGDVTPRDAIRFEERIRTGPNKGLGAFTGPPRRVESCHHFIDENGLDVVRFAFHDGTRAKTFSIYANLSVQKNAPMPGEE